MPFPGRGWGPPLPLQHLTQTPHFFCPPPHRHPSPHQRYCPSIREPGFAEEMHGVSPTPASPSKTSPRWAFTSASHLRQKCLAVAAVCCHLLPLSREWSDAVQLWPECVAEVRPRSVGPGLPCSLSVWPFCLPTQRLLISSLLSGGCALQQ